MVKKYPNFKIVAPYIIETIISNKVFLYSRFLWSTFIVSGSGRINFSPEKNKPA